MEDIAILVNDYDEIVGYKNRSELLDTERWRICSVLLLNDKYEVLITQRAANKRHSPLKWGPSCAGTLSKGESYEECALRELDEELGFKTHSLQELLYDKYEGTTGSKRYCKTYYVRCSWGIDRFVVQTGEVESLEWVELRELKRRLEVKSSDFVSGVGFLLKALVELEARVINGNLSK